LEVLGSWLHLRCHREPEPLPRHPRNLPQPRLPLSIGQSSHRHRCEPPYRCPLLGIFPPLPPDTPQVPWG
ncbi:hypothetical protein BN1723_018354, partial [Verticillium longisporum]